jgi:LuxR family maltose regulon positive regulatory protein
VLNACREESGLRASSLPDRRLADSDGVVSLTWRELDVLHLMDGRHTNKEIARLLSIAEETVKKHAVNIYGKLQVTGRRDAVARAYAIGLLKVEDRRPPQLA